MPPINIVLVHQDADGLKSLAASSPKQFLNLAIVSATPAVWEAIGRLRAQLAIVDLEAVTFQQLGDLCLEFPATAFVSIHRLADDGMWSQSLTAGAVDCCLASDLPHILESAERYVALKQAQGASAA